MRADDGDVVIAVMSDRQFEMFCKYVLGGPHAELCTNPDFSTNPARVKNRVKLISLLQEAMDQRGGTREEWERRMQNAGLTAARVRTVEEALKSDHARHRGTVEDVGAPWKQPGEADASESVLGVVPPLRAGFPSSQSEGSMACNSIDAVDNEACALQGPPPMLG